MTASFGYKSSFIFFDVLNDASIFVRNHGISDMTDK